MANHTLAGSDLHSSSIKLLAAIIKVARDDWELINDHESRRYITVNGEDYCDKGHKTLCDNNDFSSGREELLSFFYSPRFERICSEIGKRPDKARDAIGVD